MFSISAHRPFNLKNAFPSCVSATWYFWIPPHWQVTNFLEALVHHSYSLCHHPSPKKISPRSPTCLFHDWTFPPILFTLLNLVIQLDFQTRSKHIFPHQRVIDEQWHIRCSLAECVCVGFPGPSGNGTCDPRKLQYPSASWSYCSTLRHGCWTWNLHHASIDM